MKKTIVPVTEPEYTKGKAVFDASTTDELSFETAPADEEGLATQITAMQTNAVILGPAKYSGPLYDSLPPGSLIARFGVGVDGVDREKTRSKGIYLTNTPGVLDTSVAELAVFLIGSLARNVPSHSQGMRNSEWSTRIGTQLKGKTLSIIGFGNIAKEVARIAAKGLGMNIIACDVVPYEANAGFLSELETSSGVKVTYTNSIDEALSGGLFVSVHLPLMDSTKGLLDSARLSRMRKGAYLVNTSRGGIVDECALFDALSSGCLAGAAFDVFASEPYSPVRPDKDLRTLPNVIMTPHTGSNSDMSNQGMAETCVRNIRAFLDERIVDLTALP